jgi:endo-1,4-beta-xylanase
MRVRGHTLVWGKLSDRFKSPDLTTYLEDYPSEERGKVLQVIVDNHITTVLNHFKGRIHTWDVVNEPMSMLRDGDLEDNVYLKYLGEDYIAGSFVLAHAVDPDMKLFLNENFLSYTGRTAEAFIELLKKLKDNNVPVHGVGIQAHVTSKADTSIADLKYFIDRITDLGFEVEITELDARLRLFMGADDPFEAQGSYYARLLKTCMSNPSCKGLTFWGFSDSNCWQDEMPVLFPKPNDPYLFDREINPKPAYYGIYRILKDEYEGKASDPDQHDPDR